MPPSDPSPPIRAVTAVLAAHGIVPDRCDVLQDGNTLVLRLTADLVARIVQDTSGPRQGTDWVARENAIAQHLTEAGAPIIPLHPGLPAGPHLHDGYPMNFWQFVQAIDTPPQPAAIGSTLQRCHAALRSFAQPLPPLAILTESLAILQQSQAFPGATHQLLERHLQTSLEALRPLPHQPLHGDAHMGNLMHTTQRLLWTDWEDAFSGPIEWDLASAIWNAQLLEQDHATVTQILSAYQAAGGSYNEAALHTCLIARAAVMSTWYPILYPKPNPERQAKLQSRLDWLETQ
jgi:hypothetical protein